MSTKQASNEVFPDNSYGELMKQLVTARRINDGKPVANNTRLYGIEDSDGNTAVAVKLHHTNVVIHHQDGSFSLDSGGWQTVTTKERINSYTPEGFSLWQSKGNWFCRWKEQVYTFSDGMRVFLDGTVTGTIESDL